MHPQRLLTVCIPCNQMTPCTLCNPLQPLDTHLLHPHPLHPYTLTLCTPTPLHPLHLCAPPARPQRDLFALQYRHNLTGTLKEITTNLLLSTTTVGPDIGPEPRTVDPFGPRDTLSTILSVFCSKFKVTFYELLVLLCGNAA